MNIERLATARASIQELVGRAADHALMAESSLHAALGKVQVYCRPPNKLDDVRVWIRESPEALPDLVMAQNAAKDAAALLSEAATQAAASNVEHPGAFESTINGILDAQQGVETLSNEAANWTPMIRARSGETLTIDGRFIKDAPDGTRQWNGDTTVRPEVREIRGPLHRIRRSSLFESTGRLDKETFPRLPESVKNTLAERGSNHKWEGVELAAWILNQEAAEGAAALVKDAVRRAELLARDAAPNALAAGPTA